MTRAGSSIIAMQLSANAGKAVKFMTEGAIIQLPQWLKSPAGQYLLAWEQVHLDQAVADLFGFHALQLGLPQLDALRANRMPHRWLAVESARDDQVPSGLHREAPAATDEIGGDGAAARVLVVPPPSLRCHFDALPFDAASLDLVVLPHALELARDPHLALREVERVLVPEGRVLIVGFNPASLWGTRQKLGRLRRRLSRSSGELFLPHAGEFVGYRRLRDWLRLLSFEVEARGVERQGIEVTAQRRGRNDEDASALVVRAAWLRAAGIFSVQSRRNFAVARGLDREPAMRHPVGAQRIELRQAELERVKAEQIGDRAVEMALFPAEQVLSGRGLQPLRQLYDRAFCHEPDRPARICRQLHLDERRRRSCDRRSGHAGAGGRSARCPAPRMAAILMTHPRAVASGRVGVAPGLIFVTEIAAGTLGHIAYVAPARAGEPTVSRGDTLAALRIRKNPFR